MELQAREARVLSIVEAVRRGRQVEDDLVELKAQWPHASLKTARQVAGHANAAGGENILWIIGLEERTGRIGSTGGTEPADWWAAVRRHFIEVPPEMALLRVSVAPGQDVMALQFSTDRAPYVVATEGGGRVTSEVPWREGNSTRTASRSEMIRALVAEAQVPRAEMVSGSVVVSEFSPRPGRTHHQGRVAGDLRVQCDLKVYLSTFSAVHLPEHRQVLRLRTSAGALVLPGFELFGSFRYDGWSDLGRKTSLAGNIEVLGRSGVQVSGPGEFRLKAERTFRSDAAASSLLRARRVDLDLRLPVDLTDRAVDVVDRLPFVPGTSQSEPPEWDDWRVRSTFRGGNSSPSE
ncbi:hypothetical protein [Aeromicrobium sp. CnD17-E]|uniref:hypothetical protein n=1 Tax=Aeromicrobium sp. CnD17-E TaxID=2954487 RepID=UPI002096BDC2|nr:hypothetical protein [Aeromicrobium sp. CnD17-E]MCO7239068.1 hypothetical protein [Aeromicrobium sp. CnD17-E]